MTRYTVALVALSLAGCAQARQPTGGEPITTPPRVVEVSPAPHSVLTEPNRPVVIRFDARLSERLEGVRTFEEAVLVSPQTGATRVRRRRRHLEISVAGGWQPGLIYHVLVLPVIRDLFDNVRREPVELVFSTGPEIPATAVAGLVDDRLAGRAMAEARIEATHHDAGHTYVTVTDSMGFFALRHIPPGEYQLHGWLDRNGNQRRDFPEPQDSARLAVSEQDTVVLELALLPSDTTAARLASVSMIDSTKLELTFDDYFEPGPVEGTARVHRLEDSTFVAEGALFHASRLDSLRTAEREAEEAAADTVAAVVTDPTEAAAKRPDPSERRGSQAQERRALPARELILVLPRPLEYDSRYLVVVEGVTNIHGLPDGGGTSPFRTPAPPVRPDTASTDTTSTGSGSSRR